MLLSVSFEKIGRGVFENPSWDWSNTLVVTLAGFFIVFLVLLLLIIVFTAFGKIMKKLNEKEAAKKEKEIQSVPSAPAVGEVDEETAAVIVAAITEARGGKAVVIKDIKEAGK
ncbi:MAG: OadG family protein [Clostridia bacterium]|nr:OadG family protein [Clostridia bacterium]